MTSHRGAFSLSAGFSLIELLLSTGVLMLISAAATGALMKMTTSQQTIWNRTEMHSGVRGTTEVLQQEIGQAGSIPLPSPDALTGAVAVGGATVGLTSVANVFVGEQLTVDAGPSAETVTVTAVNTVAKTITTTFTLPHAAGAAVNVFGGFSAGIVPTNMVSGSTATVLKI